VKSKREGGRKSKGEVKRKKERIKITRRLHFQTTGRKPERKMVKRK
jgi:hypothetical protein